LTRSSGRGGREERGGEREREKEKREGKEKVGEGGKGGRKRGRERKKKGREGGNQERPGPGDLMKNEGPLRIGGPALGHTSPRVYTLLCTFRLSS
jgi:hypothetical protein